MDNIVLVVIGALFVAGLVGAANAGRRSWAERRSSRFSARDIRLAFPIEESAPGPVLEPQAPWRPAPEPTTVFTPPDPPPPLFPIKPPAITVAARAVDGLPARPEEPVQSRPLDARRPKSSDGLLAAPPTPIGLPVASDIELVEGKTIVFHRPSPGTVRLLPGRLEVEEGEDSPAEIRFVDVPGAAPEITFGRRLGQPFRHVQLRSLTVSREHARMAREGADWVIANLSRTNPIVVNGVALDSSDPHRVLTDGDRIEMGEVVFRYRGA